MPAPEKKSEIDTRLDAANGLEKRLCSNVWGLATKDLRERIGSSTYDRWFQHVGLDRIDEKAAWLTAPSPIYQVWIEENFRTDVEWSLGRYLSNCPKVDFEVPMEPKPATSGVAVPSGQKSSDVASVNGVDKKGETTNLRQTKELSAKILREEKNGGITEKEFLRRGRAIGLSERYWMDGFVVGDNNQLSHAAAQAVIDKPTLRYNPLFLYASPGLGKSHLLHAIGWEVLRRNPKAKIILVSGEVFTNEFIGALQKHSLVAFRKKYRQADILLMDDIQFLAAKDATQEEFFHTFNALMDARKQMVLTSDAPPAEIQSLEERLVSRFQWGMSAEMLAPQFESRMAILLRKRAEWSVEVPDWAIEFVAKRIQSNVRLMEGALMRAATVSSLNGEALTPETLEELLVDFCIDEDSRDVTLDTILEATAEHFDLQVKDLTGRRRLARVAHARQVAMWLARELTQCSLKEIGQSFGGRDHGTVLHGDRAIRKKCAADSALKRQTDFLKRAIVRKKKGGGPDRDKRRNAPYS